VVILQVEVLVQHQKSQQHLFLVDLVVEVTVVEEHQIPLLGKELPELQTLAAVVVVVVVSLVPAAARVEMGDLVLSSFDT
jgi:hypothetical protein